MWKLVIISGLVLAKVVPKSTHDDSDLRDTEIYRGKTADPEQWTWMVWIKDICGGVLLNKNWVLTAASCVNVIRDYEIVLGEFDRNITSGSEQTITVPSANIYKHPGFNAALYYNDIALLKLPETANTASRFIRKIPKLSTKSVDNAILGLQNYNCYFTGWGLDAGKDDVWFQPNELQEVEVEIIDNDKCRTLIPPIFIQTTNICFKPRGGLCKKDRGGPVMCRVNSRWTLMGMYSVSGPLDGCRGGARAATRVSQYRDWIINTRKAN